mmetsp:Transcript_25594/g.35338  ORF Transcript_25594/g.35338 Transcript_25594/m.35338 type:complete len:210 (+) Transcript_25594:367-996(+)
MSSFGNQVGRERKPCGRTSVTREPFNAYYDPKAYVSNYRGECEIPSILKKHQKGAPLFSQQVSRTDVPASRAAAESNLSKTLYEAKGESVFQRETKLYGRPKSTEGNARHLRANPGERTNYHHDPLAETKPRSARGEQVGLQRAKTSHEIKRPNSMYYVSGTSSPNKASQNSLIGASSQPPYTYPYAVAGISPSSYVKQNPISRRITMS